jgi:hypothetical protein
MRVEQRMLEFIDSRLDSLLRRPSAWGPPTSIEDQVLQLLEMRRFVLDPRLTHQDTRKLTSSYVVFISRVLGSDSTPEPLVAQLQRRGRADELPQLLRRFADEEIANSQHLRARPAKPIEFPEPRPQP